MQFIEIMMRALTHLNIGATIVIVAWLLFSVNHKAKADTRIPIGLIDTLSSRDSRLMHNVTACAVNQSSVNNRPICRRTHS
jgi:hypothetical protein